MVIEDDSTGNGASSALSTVGSVTVAVRFDVAHSAMKSIAGVASTRAAPQAAKTSAIDGGGLSS